MGYRCVISAFILMMWCSSTSVAAAEMDSETNILRDLIDYFFVESDPPELEKVICRNLESSDLCNKFDQGFDHTQGLKPLDLSKWVNSTYVQTFDQRLNNDEVRALFDEAKYDELNQYFDKAQNLFEEGVLGEFEYNQIFHHAIRSLNAIPNVRFDDWVKHDPAFVYALLARSQNYYDKGWAVRGQKLASETPERSMQAMKAHMNRSIADLKSALELKPKCVFAHQALISSSHMAGDSDETTKGYLKDALDIMPAAYYPHKRYMSFLTPKWGGSHLEMREFAVSAQRFADEQPLLRFLLALEYSNRAQQLVWEGQYQKALNAYDKAMYHGVDTGMLENTVWLKHTMKKYQAALQDAALLIEMYPDNASYKVKRGSLRYASKQYELGLQDYEKAVEIEPSLSKAWQGIAYYYYWVKRDFDEAQKFYRKSVLLNSQNTESQYRLAWSLIELHKPQGLDEMRQFIKICGQVKCKAADIAWASEWVGCIDGDTACSMDPAEYRHWRFAGEADLH